MCILRELYGAGVEKLKIEQQSFTVSVYILQALSWFWEVFCQVDKHIDLMSLYYFHQMSVGVQTSDTDVDLVESVQWGF